MPDPNKANIMIVDDALFSREMLKTILQKAGYTISSEAENGLDALKKYKEPFPDLITMDIIMPQMDGITAVQQIRKQNPKAKIVMISSIGSEKKVMQALKAGATNFILKPFEPEQIIKIIEKVMAKQV